LADESTDREPRLAQLCCCPVRSNAWRATGPGHRQASSSLHIIAVVGDVYQALADPTRRKILDELAGRDGQTLFEICSRLAMKHRLTSSRHAISQHLDVLEAAGLIVTRRDGRYKFHHLDTRPLEHIADRWLSPDPHRRSDENQPDQRPGR
jgi:DNA-binding transcriptional ArsR family regulator